MLKCFFVRYPKAFAGFSGFRIIEKGMRRMGRILEYDFGILRRQFFHPVFNAVNQV